ncbi:MAG: hypothetical protein KJO41_06115 [Bacteroidia bacterium]|nr:hypothetical protein [Bacteroidia bacterium]MBT8278559.1 hypothetical protein [Bacteroidia bacterium]NND25021.1 hypothetical protein [Flavobacteriaceae bacterium]NNK59547.1 hypothetical protein [Flavobacteriaceae bacterium]NNL32488.1 hypothetical protein [Flavobacteriaceae bacterium]
MKKMILIIALFTFPLLSVSQNDIDATELNSRENVASVIVYDLESNPVILELNTEIISYRKVEPISPDPIDQNKSINFIKSNELISIKAYIKSLQMKRKTTEIS